MVKRLFILAAAIGLMVNLISDVALSRQHQKAINTGVWVNHGYEFSQAVAAVRIAILESRIKNQPAPELSEKLKNLNLLAEDIPRVKNLLSKLNQFTPEQLSQQNQSREALIVLTELQSTEDEQIRLRVKADEESNSAVMTSALYANIFDIFLIFLFVVFFFYELKKSLKIQKTLTQTLADVDANNQNLQLALAKKNSQFKTTVHDLKNPLGSIKGFAELMTDENENKDSILEMARVIQSVSNNSLALVSALLNETDPEMKPSESLNLGDCLQETCTFLGPVARKKNQTIQLKNSKSLVTLFGKRHQIQDIFFNIIGNALKFSPPDCSVLVESLYEDKSYVIRVTDRGPGFSEQDFKKMFTPGVKLSARPTGDEISTGFGLLSARQSIENCGGRIQVTNVAPKGACVHIFLPAQLAREEENLTI